MSLKEQRKKIQRSILFLVENSPPDLVLRELKLIQQTLDAQIKLVSPSEGVLANVSQ